MLLLIHRIETGWIQWSLLGVLYDIRTPLKLQEILLECYKTSHDLLSNKKKVLINQKICSEKRVAKMTFERDEGQYKRCEKIMSAFMVC